MVKHNQHVMPRTGKWAMYTAVAAFCLTTSAAFAGPYVRVPRSAPVKVVYIYTNEWGSPFVKFDAKLNDVCADGGAGLYLYNISLSPTSNLYRNNKMAVLISAKVSGKPVVLDYYYETENPPAGWDNCYIHGIQIQD